MLITCTHLVDFYTLIPLKWDSSWLDENLRILFSACLPFWIVTPWEDGCLTISNYLCPEGKGVSCSTWDTHDLDVSEGLHKGGNCTLANICGVTNTELSMLVWAHDIELLGVGYHSGVLETTRYHLNSLVEFKTLWHVVATIVAAIEP